MNFKNINKVELNYLISKDFIHVTSQGDIHLFKREFPIGTVYIKKHDKYWQCYCMKADKNKKIFLNTRNFDSDYHKELNLAVKNFWGQIKAYRKEVQFVEDSINKTLSEMEF